MNLLKCSIGGLIGALVGAVIWAAIAHYTNFEFGIIAWLVGILAGFGVQVALRNESCAMAGVIALVCASAGLVGGKYAAVRMDVSEYLSSEASALDDRHLARVLIADDIIVSWEADGRTIKWPSGMTLEDAWEERDYPAEVWQAMEQTWDAMSEEERNDRVREVQESESDFTSAISREAFLASFTPFDGFWFILALASAWKIAESEEMF